MLLVPLYPQYAAATSATVCDKTFEALAAMRWQPTLRVAPPWHDDPAYIEALATSIREGLAKLDFEPEAVLASFHGVPMDYLLKGDPYHCQCAKTARLLRVAVRAFEQHGADAAQSQLHRQRQAHRPAADDHHVARIHPGLPAVRRDGEGAAFVLVDLDKPFHLTRRMWKG